MAYTSEYPFVYVTVDVAVLAIDWEQGLSALMVRRGGAPYKGRLALPGGFVDEREDLERAARRELKEETGVGSRSVRLEQLGAYGAPRRDPRHRIISVAHVAVLPEPVDPTAGDDASAAAWHPVADLLSSRLAFDHATILRDAVERVSQRLESTTLATSFLPELFTISDLRAVYETVWGAPLDPGNFQRKVTGTPGFVLETGQRTAGGRGRPAALFRAGPAEVLAPPLARVTAS